MRPKRSATRATTVDGLELTAATNLVGPFLLTHLLWSRLRSDARVVHVSSGGMYSQKLDVQTLFDPPELGDRLFVSVRRGRPGLFKRGVGDDQQHRVAGRTGHIEQLMEVVLVGTGQP